MCIAKGSVQTTKVHKFLVIFFLKMCFSLRVLYWKKSAEISQLVSEAAKKWTVSMETNVCVAEEVLPTQSAFFKPIMYIM